MKKKNITLQIKSDGKEFVIELKELGNKTLEVVVTPLNFAHAITTKHVDVEIKKPDDNKGEKGQLLMSKSTFGVFFIEVEKSNGSMAFSFSFSGEEFAYLVSGRSITASGETFY